jgi:hypothetical protein
MKDELPAVHFAFLWRDWLTPCRKKRGVPLAEGTNSEEPNPQSGRQRYERPRSF